MAAFTARMAHPAGPHPFPEDVTVDRDYSRDPRSVFAHADTEEDARAVFELDNPEFAIITLAQVDED